jgi:hypothetical protein
MNALPNGQLTPLGQERELSRDIDHGQPLA